MARKLVCDRCGYDLTEKDDIDLALEGQAAWARSARERGAEPRGIIPCKNYVRCQGEMIIVEERRGLFARRSKPAKGA
jgi:hypothetical protein